MGEQIRDRSVVPADWRSWGVPFEGYVPVDIGLQWGAADEPDDPRDVTNWPERQGTALIPFEVIDGVPYNPGGRTGRVGRDTERYGEWACADALVLAGTGEKRLALMICREDCGEWAIPGGGVDPGESPVQTALRELREETGVDLDPDSDGVRVFDLGAMLCDDPRNTDTAWYATTLVVILIDQPVPATGADDAVEAWWTAAKSLPDLLFSLPGTLYRPHQELLDEGFGFVEELERLPETLLGDRERLVQALRAGARGDQAGEAAVELLIQHQVWLDRDEFASVIELVDPNPDVWAQTAVIDWDAVTDQRHRWAATGSEHLVLRIAASLATGFPVDLSEVSRLDRENLRLVVTAITHASAGYHAAQFAVPGGVRGWWA